MAQHTNPPYNLRRCGIDDVRELCERFHGYASAGGLAVYAFGVYEGLRMVAAYAWQPPPPGSGTSVCPEAPQGVLSLSRMVAVPRDERALRHVSKPLRRQMLHEIDRTRWPVLVTYSDEGQGHTGHVYKCSGWQPTSRERRPFFLDADGHRASSYANGKSGTRDLKRGGTTTLQRWEHWICDRGKAAEYMTGHGWERSPIPGKTWRSGRQAYEYVRKGPQLDLFASLTTPPTRSAP